MEQPFPFIEPPKRLPAARRPQALKILDRPLGHTVGINGDLAGDRVGKPQAPLLVPSHPKTPRAKRFDIAPPHPPVLAHRREREIPSVTEINNVLARRVENRCDFARRQEILLVESAPHPFDGPSPEQRNRHRSRSAAMTSSSGAWSVLSASRCS